MIHEYVIEPASIFKILDPRTIFDSIGPSHGRFVSSPTLLTWLNKINENLQHEMKDDSHLTMLRQKIIEDWVVSHRLQPKNIDFIIERDVPELYDTDVSISGKAIPNAKIITTDGRKKTYRALDISNKRGWWRVKPSLEISKKTSDYMLALSPIISIAKKILIMDPHYKGLGHQIAVIQSICNVVDKYTASSVEIVCLYDPKSKPPLPNKEEWFGLCNRDIKPIFKGTQVRVRILRVVEVSTKEHKARRFHDRFLLTDRGSYSVGFGFENNGNTYHYDNATHISIYNQATAVKKMQAIDALRSEGDYDSYHRFELRDIWSINDHNPADNASC